MHGGADAGARRLVPHDEFTLDVFVFNQSVWTRRFEVSVWERRRRRQGHAHGVGVGGGPGAGPGIVPLESRVRVGCVHCLIPFPFSVFLSTDWLLHRRQAIATSYVPVCANVVSRARAGRAYDRGADSYGHRDATCADVEVGQSPPGHPIRQDLRLLRFRTSMDVVVHETRAAS